MVFRRHFSLHSYILKVFDVLNCKFCLGGFDVNGLDERGLTPLMWSAAYGQVEI